MVIEDDKIIQSPYVNALRQSMFIIFNIIHTITLYTLCMLEKK